MANEKPRSRHTPTQRIPKKKDWESLRLDSEDETAGRIAGRSNRRRNYAVVAGNHRNIGGVILERLHCRAWTNTRQQRRAMLTDAAAIIHGSRMGWNSGGMTSSNRGMRSSDRQQARGSRTCNNDHSQQHHGYDS